MSHVCPLCDRGFDVRTDLRMHLLTVHHKSDVVDELLTVDAKQNTRRPVT